MAREQKITDEQVNRHLCEGMSQKAIAELYDMRPGVLSARIKKMREQGRLQIEKVPDPEQSIKKMDTVVRLSDRRWFRVLEVKEQEAELKTESVTSCDYLVKREYLNRIDTILTTVGIAEASEETAIRTKQLIAQILHDGIREERTRMEAEES